MDLKLMLSSVKLGKVRKLSSLDFSAITNDEKLIKFQSLYSDIELMGLSLLVKFGLSILMSSVFSLLVKWPVLVSLFCET